jgi:crotonobetainyl-CoA:carnitine CoA-transferase CaiB-like acyl-CoA transferase
MYAESLLASLDEKPVSPPQLPGQHPALAWAESGLMALTGRPDGEPQMCPVPLASCADGALAALQSLAPLGALDGLRGANLLAERAALVGHQRSGSGSPGGGCRLLEAADGRIAVSLARDEDWVLAPAWLENENAQDWLTVRAMVRRSPVGELVERGRVLGLAVAADALPPAPASWFEVVARGPLVPQCRFAPLVVDLSSLWAGPLCADLLRRCGARVLKVESLTRPDGARRGARGFYALLNAGKRGVALDFASEEGRAQLRTLLSRADIVIEASRPRALRQLGIEAEALLAENPGMTWLAISGHGRGEPQQHWAGYGDDAAVAAGLSWVMHQASGDRLIVGDAIADPLTGLHAALAAWASHLGGGGRLVSLALSGVVRHCIGFDLPEPADLRDRQERWTALAAANMAPPQGRQAAGAVREQGADTAVVLEELGIS